MLNRKQAIQQMNVWGSIGQPFYFIINYEATGALLATDTQEDCLRFSFHQQNQRHTQGKKISFLNIPVTLDEYRVRYEKVIENIHYGNSFLVNLTQQTPIQTNLSLGDIFKQSRAKYKVLLEDQFVCFSPETFIRTEHNCIFSHPMKGTIRADIFNAEEKILNDPKETAEHVTIVDLIRNDLSMVATRVTVDRFRYIEKLETNKGPLLQVSSEIKGELPPHWQNDLGNLLFKMLPAGSITGAPKPQTMDIINKTEEHERGFYTGVCGYFDGEDLDTGVMIRFIEQKGNQLYFKSGGGITAFSNLESEYQEMIDKIYVPVY